MTKKILKAGDFVKIVHSLILKKMLLNFKTAKILIIKPTKTED